MALDATSSTADRLAVPRASDTLSRRPLRDALRGDLVWRHPGLFRRELELWAGSEKLASLRFIGLLRAGVVAESADGGLTYERIGLFRGHVRVRDAATQAEIARFDCRWTGGGKLCFASGAEYRWSSSGLWRTRWGWSLGEEDRFLAFRSIFSLLGDFEMEAQPQALRVAELPVLVLTGAYLMEMIICARAS